MGRIYRALMLCKGSNCIDVVAFIDSGSDKTIISKRVAKKLKIKPHGKGKIVIADKTAIITEIGKVRVISHNDKIDDIMEVNITDVPFEMDIDDLDMIIGIDFLQKHKVKLIFK